MPVFEYRCVECDSLSSELVRKPEEVPTHCHCGGELAREISVFAVSGTRPVDPGSLRSTPREILDRPERFGEAMAALQERAGVRIDNERIDGAMHRLSEAKKE